MKIAIFTDSFPPAVDGVAYYTFQLANWMSKENEVYVFTMGKENGWKRENFEVYRFKGNVLRTYP